MFNTQLVETKGGCHATVSETVSITSPLLRTAADEIVDYCSIPRAQRNDCGTGTLLHASDVGATAAGV
jgi:hypothetical protein